MHVKDIALLTQLLVHCSQISPAVSSWVSCHMPRTKQDSGCGPTPNQRISTTSRPTAPQARSRSVLAAPVWLIKQVDVWEDRACAAAILTVVFAKSFDEKPLFGFGSDNEQSEGEHASSGDKPVRGDQAIGQSAEQCGGVERVADVPVGPVRYEFVLFSRYNGICNIVSDGPKRPDQEEHRGETKRDTTPAKSIRHWQLRPGHPGRVYHEGKHAQHGDDADWAQGRENEPAFLSAVEWLAGSLRANSMIEPKGRNDGGTGDQQPAKRIIAHRRTSQRLVH